MQPWLGSGQNLSHQVCKLHKPARLWEQLLYVPQKLFLTCPTGTRLESLQAVVDISSSRKVLRKRGTTGDTNGRFTSHYSAHVCGAHALNALQLCKVPCKMIGWPRSMNCVTAEFNLSLTSVSLSATRSQGFDFVFIFLCLKQLMSLGHGQQQLPPAHDKFLMA